MPTMGPSHGPPMFGRPRIRLRSRFPNSAPAINPFAARFVLGLVLVSLGHASIEGVVANSLRSIRCLSQKECHSHVIFEAKGLLQEGSQTLDAQGYTLNNNDAIFG